MVQLYHAKRFADLRWAGFSTQMLLRSTRLSAVVFFKSSDNFISHEKYSSPLPLLSPQQNPQSIRQQHMPAP